MSKYDDILHLPRPVSARRNPMRLQDRAAQFAPFAALTGYDGVIAETGRLTQEAICLDEDGRELLDAKLRRLCQQLSRRPLVRFCIFRPDGRKSGGAYETVAGYVKKIDSITRCIVLETGEVLPLERIYGMEWEGEDLPFSPEDGMMEENSDTFPEVPYEIPQG